jgi:predicted ATP-grasp superfamily ATP-dependent carboligase
MAMTTNDLPLARFDPDRPPVVLMGGINLVRTLGLAGLQAVVATPDRHEPALRSRYCSARWLLPPLASASAIESLAQLGRTLSTALGRRIPLMYGSDDALELIQAHEDRLRRYFVFLLSAPPVARALIAKDRFEAFAEARGLPAPQALAWDGEGAGSVRGTPGPVLVKPRSKVDWHHSALCQRLFGGDGKARIFPSGEAASADADLALFHPQLTFQKYVPGGDIDLWSFHGFADERGEVLASFIGRKVRTYPTLTGESAFIELGHDDSLDAVGREVARLCPMRGVFKMDFKRDSSDGSWYLLEINARYNLWHYLGARNGANLMAAAYEYLVDGTRPAPVRADTRYRWLSLDLDFKAYRELAGRGETTFTQWAGSLLRSRNIYNVFAWHDPVPWIHFWVSRVARRLFRGPARLNAALRQWRSTAS